MTSPTDAEVDAAVEPIKNLLRLAGREGAIVAAQRVTEFTRYALDASAAARPAPAAAGLEAEIERLNAYQNETALAWTKHTESQEAENERLTKERDDARWVIGVKDKQIVEFVAAHDAAVAENERLQSAKRRALALADERGKENDRLRAAIDAFSKATCLPGGPSLAMQRHDPTWEAWKALCAALNVNEQKAGD